MEHIRDHVIRYRYGYCGPWVFIISFQLLLLLLLLLCVLIIRKAAALPKDRLLEYARPRAVVNDLKKMLLAFCI